MKWVFLRPFRPHRFIECSAVFLWRKLKDRIEHCNGSQTHSHYLSISKVACFCSSTYGQHQIPQVPHGLHSPLWLQVSAPCFYSCNSANPILFSYCRSNYYNHLCVIYCSWAVIGSGLLLYPLLFHWNLLYTLWVPSDPVVSSGLIHSLIFVFCIFFLSPYFSFL